MPTTTPVFLEEYHHLHPADLADRLQRVPADEATAILQQLPRSLAAAALSELERAQAAELLAVLPSEALAGLLQELPPNAAADLAGAMPPKARRTALAALPAEKAAPISALLRHRPDTAGGIMTDRLIALRADLTVQAGQELLRARAEQRPEEVSYLYITDEQGRLIGIVPLRDLVFSRPERRMGEIMNRDVKFLRVEDDQEEIARQFEHYHYLGMPVLDREGRLVGVVKANDALHVAQAEATEDMQLMVGLSGEERALTPWQKSIGRRLPWLYVNLGTAFLAASVVSLFENTIARWTALAVFLPIIAGQGGNAGMQTLTVIIRDLALGELTPGDGRKALLKELMLGLVNGLAIGLVVGVAGFLWKGSVALGVVAMLAMLLNQVSAALAGVAIPFGLKALRVDPALASSIFVTTVTDVAGFFFFLGLAVLAMRWVGA
ncbi:MAG: magnesium transporter [Verrucomicrobia bacterium]|nr:magnesium transporter [Verrucomicrobiota bacterium]